jgi:hypothetical protein
MLSGHISHQAPRILFTLHHYRAPCFGGEVNVFGQWFEKGVLVEFVLPDFE